MKGVDILSGSGNLSAVGPCTPVNSYAASHERVGGVAAVGMCFMGTLDQFVCDGSRLKGLVVSSEQLFFFGASPVRSCRTYFTKGFP